MSHTQEIREALEAEKRSERERIADELTDDRGILEAEHPDIGARVGRRGERLARPG